MLLENLGRGEEGDADIQNWQMCKKFLPIMRPKTGRIVNVSSTVCHLNGFHSDELKKEISNPDLTIEHLSEMMERYKVSLDPILLQS